MIRSEEIGELAAALCAAQAEFPAVPKTGENPFFKSKYAALPVVVETASPIITKHGLAVTQLLGYDEGGDTLTTCLLHKSGQFIAESMRMRPQKNDPQAQGSATSYARRYAYMSILGLVADEDDDGNKGSQPPSGRNRTAAPSSPPVSGQKVIDKASLAALRRAYKETGWTENRLYQELVNVGVHNPDDIAYAMANLTERQATGLLHAMVSAVDTMLAKESDPVAPEL